MQRRTAHVLQHLCKIHRLQCVTRQVHPKIYIFKIKNKKRGTKPRKQQIVSHFRRGEMLCKIGTQHTRTLINWGCILMEINKKKIAWRVVECPVYRSQVDAFTRTAALKPILLFLLFARNTFFLLYIERYGPCILRNWITRDGPPATISAGIWDRGQFSILMICKLEHKANSKGKLCKFRLSFR